LTPLILNLLNLKDFAAMPQIAANRKKETQAIRIVQITESQRKGRGNEYFTSYRERYLYKKSLDRVIQSFAKDFFGKAVKTGTSQR
jgi:hypothetical protein